MSSKLSFSDVLALRRSNEPLTGEIAPVLTPEMFKSPRCFEKPPARSMEHHLNFETRSRSAATLKAAGSELNGDVISLGTGRPSPEYFPISRLTLDLPKGPDFSESKPQRLTSTAIEKYGLQDKSCSFDLAVSLNYGYSAGSEQLIRFVTEHVDVVHNPPYSDWQCSLTAGSTSALDAVFRMFCNRGDYIITEEYTYSGVLEGVRPLGIRTVGIQMDEQGLCPHHLEKLLSEWDASARGAEKPSILYTIPTGQNPSGLTQDLRRRQEIYAVAEKHDLYIIEDDPYFFLQFESQSSDATATYLRDLIPSYLSLDVSGRVLRLDSTSKTIAPGFRCSWMTGAASVISRFLYFYDTSIVSPSGFSQLAMHTLLDEVWGHEGFIQWLIYLRDEYKQRRNTIISACEAGLPQSVCSWTVPKAGMFHWIKIDWQKHPSAVSSAGLDSDKVLDIEDRVHSTALKMGVLCCKGSTFCADGPQSNELYFRTTYATASLLEIQKAIARLGEAICAEFGVSS